MNGHVTWSRQVPRRTNLRGVADLWRVAGRMDRPRNSILCIGKSLGGAMFAL